jgi:hypothetical protein
MSKSQRKPVKVRVIQPTHAMAESAKEAAERD